jgi:hypothetical protein
MRYLVAHDFEHGGWTADKFVRALSAPLAAIGILEVRVARPEDEGKLGFQADGLTGHAYNAKYTRGSKIVRAILDGSPPKE